MIGTQLDLFAQPDLLPGSPSAQAVPPAFPDLSTVDVLVVRGPQLDLFAERHLRLERARRTLSEGCAGEAVRELRDLLHRYPGDLAILAALELAQDVERRLRRIDGAAVGERPGQLLALARSVPVDLQAAVLRRAAEALRHSDPAALFDSKAASVLLLHAGDLDAAQAAAEAAANASDRARFLAYLADVEHQRGRRDRTRERYRAALALDPHDVDWDEIRDDEVRSLPGVARLEFELEDGVAWSAPVGVVLGILPLGRAPVITADADVHGGGSSVARAQRFLAALIRDRGGIGGTAGGVVIDARRQMRALAPQLLAAYLEAK